MKVTVTFRHIEATEALKSHVERKIEKFKKYLIRPIDAHIILDVIKFRQRCEINLSARNFSATAVEISENLYTSIDEAIHKIERQIRKHKEIVKDHKNNLPVHETAAQAEELFEKIVDKQL